MNTVTMERPQANDLKTFINSLTTSEIYGLAILAKLGALVLEEERLRGEREVEQPARFERGWEV